MRAVVDGWLNSLTHNIHSWIVQWLHGVNTQEQLQEVVLPMMLIPFLTN
jgi:hypothetical protein